MSIVDTVTPRTGEDIYNATVEAADEPQDAPLVGWSVAIGVCFVQIILVMLFFKLGQMANGVAAAHGAHITWTADVMPAIPALVGCVLPLVVIPGAFGARSGSGRYHQWLNSMPRWRWQVAALVWAAVTAADVAGYVMVESGYGLAERAVWLRGGREVASHGWSEATSLTLGCHMTGGRSHRPQLEYRVTFADGRSANLADRIHPGGGLSAWMDNLAPIQAALPWLAPQVSYVSSTCLGRYGSGEAAETMDRLKRLLRQP